MLVRDVMTGHNLAFSPPDATLQDIASMMVEHDCGAIPVVEPASRKLVGIVTDRDIACRAVAVGLSPSQTRAEDILTMPIHTVSPDATIDECVLKMEELQLRRMPVADEQGRLVGIIAQADIARSGPERTTAELVKDISKPSEHASKVQ